MRKNRQKTIWNTRTIVMLGFMAALTIVLTRVARIEIGPAIRLSLGSACTILTGLWFGPAAGGLTGAVADLLGFMFQPSYTFMPLITFSAAMWGILPGLFSGLIRGTRTRKTAVICCIVTATSVICQLGLTTFALAQMLGVPYSALLAARAAQFFGSTPVYCLTAVMLYLSPITQMVHEEASGVPKPVSAAGRQTHG